MHTVRLAWDTDLLGFDTCLFRCGKRHLPEHTSTGAVIAERVAGAPKPHPGATKAPN